MKFYYFILGKYRSIALIDELWGEFGDVKEEANLIE